MNKFKQAIRDSKTSRESHEQKMVEFSRLLREKMELSHQDVRDAYDAEVVFEAPPFKIEPRNICLTNCWAVLLVILPYRSDTPNPYMWVYKPAGTRTIIYPKQQRWDEVLSHVHP